MKRVCFGSWSEEMTFDQMNEFVLLRPGAGSRSERGRWKDSMKHDLAARICLLLNHSLYLQPDRGTCDPVYTKSTQFCADFEVKSNDRK